MVHMCRMHEQHVDRAQASLIRFAAPAEAMAAIRRVVGWSWGVGGRQRGGGGVVGSGVGAGGVRGGLGLWPSSPPWPWPSAVRRIGRVRLGFAEDGLRTSRAMSLAVCVSPVALPLWCLRLGGGWWLVRW